MRLTSIKVLSFFFVTQCYTAFSFSAVQIKSSSDEEQVFGFKLFQPIKLYGLLEAELVPQLCSKYSLYPQCQKWVGAARWMPHEGESHWIFILAGILTILYNVVYSHLHLTIWKMWNRCKTGLKVINNINIKNFGGHKKNKKLDRV